MERRQFLSALGAGLFSVWGSEGSATEPAQTLSRFASVDWQQYAVMTKPPGVEPPWRLRLDAEHQASRAGDEVVDDLIGFTKHASPHVRAFAAQMLGVIGDPGSLERLRALVESDPAAIVRNYAVEGLSRLPIGPADTSIATSLAVARRDPNRNVQFSAQQAMLRRQQRVPGGAALQAEWVRGFDLKRLASAQVGHSAPSFAITADTGRAMRLSDYRQRHAVVLLFQLADW